MKSNHPEKIFVPIELHDWMKRIESKLDQSQKIPQVSNEEGIVGDYVSEARAKELLGRGSTWFYYQRRDGRIRSYKLGSRNFYKMSDLQKLIEDGIQD